ncbi:MAG: hypothetical protein KME40_32610 [Komarekiella atlantica HA4396-MV6]|jgi:hypothetical protein|nr:hypothetical protein [Komarekiella atlantica HA4396-MV6]
MLIKKTLELQKGIKIFFQTDIDFEKHRIFLSSGTSTEVEQTLAQIKYCKGAFVPKESWREPNIEEKTLLGINEQLVNINMWDLHQYIGLIRIPDKVLAPLEAILENVRKSPAIALEEWQAVVTHPEVENVIVEVSNYLMPYCLFRHRFKVLGLYIKPPGLKTVTVNSVNNQSENLYIGMHLDSWDRYPLRRRHKSRNRICINLGCEDRFFLFINLTLIDMFYALGLLIPKDIHKHYRGTELGNEFMKQYPSYPVVKLTVRPNEAYIAPTDNLIHDASTRGRAGEAVMKCKLNCLV